MASDPSKSSAKPPKSILKTSSSFDQPDNPDGHKEMKWDEMNILATYHPSDKDYGHTKIDEPPTPYSRLSEFEDEENGEDAEAGGTDLDPGQLADMLIAKKKKKPTVVDNKPGSTTESSDEDLDETEEARAKRKAFEQKRKLHYNEYYAVKLAKQLLTDDDDDENTNTSQVTDCSAPQ